MLATIISPIIASLILTQGNYNHATKPQRKFLSSHEISLTDRYPVKSVSDVFKDNILLTIDYMANQVPDKQQINWSKVEQPMQYEMQIKPKQVFAFHDNILPEYKNNVIQTTNAHFNSSEGFKSDGYLVGDGVCHLASLINWAAKDAKLGSVAPTNHNFANIPEVPKEYGVAIYNQAGSDTASQNQNLYVTNNYAKPIDIAFSYNGDKLKVSIYEEE